LSAVVLRELVAKLGLTVDEGAFERADQGLKKVKKGLEEVDRKTRDASGRFVRGAQDQAAAVEAQATKQAASARRRAKDGPSAADTFQQYLGGAAVFAALKGMTELASSANETENVLKELFGAPGVEQVKGWSDVTSVALNRSKYQLREAAGTFGALLTPVTSNTEEVRNMSEALSVLAIDLASFYNTSDEEAMLALRSGIIGQSEPLLKYAVNVQEATLKEYARTQGITKSVEKMTNAEKTLLRYKSILEQSTKATGDATRTAGEYANMLRGVHARVTELATDLGKKLLPPLKALFAWANPMITAFGKLAESSYIFEGLLGALGLTILRVFGGKLWALTTFGLRLGLIGAALDDIINFANGADSGIGRLLNALGGEGTSTKWLEAISQALRDMTRDWEKFVAAVRTFSIPDKWDAFLDKLHTAQGYFDQIARSITKAMMGRERGNLITKEQYNRYGKGNFSRLDALSDDERAEAERAVDAYNARLRFDAAEALRKASDRASFDASFAAPAPGDPDLALGLAGDQLSAPVDSGPNMSVQFGDTTINMSLPPGANPIDVQRATQRGVDIANRQALDAVRQAAGKVRR